MCCLAQDITDSWKDEQVEVLCPSLSIDSDLKVLGCLNSSFLRYFP